MINFRVDVRGIDDVKKSLSCLQGDLRDKAMAAAINKTASKANTEIKRAVTEEFNISQSEVANSINIGRARSLPGGLEAKLTIFGSTKKKGRSLNVIHFLERSITIAEAKRRRKKGDLYGIGKSGRLLPILGFKFKRSGGIKKIEGVFVGNNGRTVFVRTGDKRLPIKPAQMIGVSQMFTTGRIRIRVMDRINQELPVEVDRAVKMVLERFGK